MQKSVDLKKEFASQRKPHTVLFPTETLQYVIFYEKKNIQNTSSLNQEATRVKVKIKVDRQSCQMRNTFSTQ